jgi:hypothetical protein
MTLLRTVCRPAGHKKRQLISIESRSLKGIFQQKLGWAQSGVTVQLALFNVGAMDIFWFILKENYFGFSKKTFSCHLSPNYWSCGKELVKC